MRQMIFVMVRIQLLDQFIADLNILGTEENIAPGRTSGSALLKVLHGH